VAGSVDRPDCGSGQPPLWSLVHESLEALQRQQANLLRGRLRLEHHLFLGEWIDAFTSFRRGLLHDFHLEQARQREPAVATEAPLNNAIERLEDCGDLLTGQFGIAADLSHDL